jgi:hypothetical protein
MGVILHFGDKKIFGFFSWDMANKNGTTEL